MKLTLIVACSALTLAGVLGTTGCSGDRYHRTAGKVMDDTTLTSKIKADMYADPIVKGTQVDVTTYRGVVQLSGFVDTEEQKQRAQEIAQRFPVASVQNNLAIKPEPAGSAR